MAATANPGVAHRLNRLGLGPIDSPSGAFAADTRTIFTIAGGPVLITCLYAIVTTAITAANTVKLQTNPTTGDTIDINEATDIGTTDTAVGTIIGFTPSIDDPATSGALQEWSLLRNGGALRDLIVPIGDIEQVTTGSADGAVTWTAFYIPLVAGASLVAS